jgi:hypothetical protein
VWCGAKRSTVMGVEPPTLRRSVTPLWAKRLLAVGSSLASPYG